MEFNKKYDVDAMLNEVSSDGDISDNIETDDADKVVENGEKNLMKKPLTVEEHRALRRKSKKNLGRQNSKEGALGVANAPNFQAPQRRWKNSRRSRNGHGRGLTKKAGGGRGNWGKPGSELLEELELDQNDPNYNEDEDLANVEFKVIVCAEEDTSIENEFLKNYAMSVLEYFEHGDTHEVATEIDEHMKSGNLRPLVIRKAVEIAMEHKSSHREMTSVLLSDLYGRCLISSDYERGFDMLLSMLPDLTIDIPEAPHFLGAFIARAVADDCMPPKYVHNLSRNGKSSSPKNGHAEVVNGKAIIDEPLDEIAQQCIDYAEGHLSRQTSWAHLDNVWGVAGGLRPVKTITKHMELLLKEYLMSRDIEEAQRCIIALEVPHFHHELIYEAIVMTLEALNEGVEESMAKLLKSLEQTCIVTMEVMEQGFQRIFEDIQDISLDIPLAYIILERFTQRCYNLGLANDKLLKNLPSRGRKRFVSEGDSGLIKPSSMMFRDF